MPQSWDFRGQSQSSKSSKVLSRLSSPFVGFFVQAPWRRQSKSHRGSLGADLQCVCLSNADREAHISSCAVSTGEPFGGWACDSMRMRMKREVADVTG